MALKPQLPQNYNSSPLTMSQNQQRGPVGSGGFSVTLDLSGSKPGGG